MVSSTLSGTVGPFRRESSFARLTPSVCSCAEGSGHHEFVPAGHPACRGVRVPSACGGPPVPPSTSMEVASITALAKAQLAAATTAESGRSSVTVYGRCRARLRQTIVALAVGRVMGEHKSPRDASVFCLPGSYFAPARAELGPYKVPSSTPHARSSGQCPRWGSNPHKADFKDAASRPLWPLPASYAPAASPTSPTSRP
jgi:hypothetical protein